MGIGALSYASQPAVAMPKAARMYPAEDAPARNPSQVQNPTKLRASITPGTVLILLAGRFKGKRVVFLKQLDSGLLLVTGPFKVNGVPLRRVNQRYVIATSTSVDVPGANVGSVGDAFFKREAAAKAKKGEEEFFATEGKKKEVVAEKVAMQKSVDAAIAGKLDATMKGYLGARFSLKSGQYPHDLKF